MSVRRAFVETRTWMGSGVGRCNEDYACVGADGRCAVLVDGATGLTGANLVSGESDAAWYARHLAQEAVAWASSGDRSASDAMRVAGRVVADAYLGYPGARELVSVDMPNGSVATACWDERLEISMLGDCTAVVGRSDGTSDVIHDATLDELDRANYERMFRYATKHGVTMKDARKALNDRFVENRLLINEPGGYWAADVSCRGFGHEIVRSFELRDVAYVVLFTDGLAAAVEMGVVGTPSELARRIARGGGERLGEALRAAEQRDAGCWAHPRSKTSDDATYVLISFGA